MLQGWCAEISPHTMRLDVSEPRRHRLSTWVSQRVPQLALSEARTAEKKTGAMVGPRSTAAIPER